MTEPNSLERVLSAYRQSLQNVKTVEYIAEVKEVRSSLIICSQLKVKIADICYIEVESGERLVGEVVGFDEEEVFIMLLTELKGITKGDKVYSYGESLHVQVGDGLLGRVLNCFGRPLDDEDVLENIAEFKSVFRSPPHVLNRKPIESWIKTGVRSIDAFMSIGMGQRMGIFAQAGLGKSSLLSMFCRNGEADVNVISLVGERGREVKEFIEDVLGEEAMKRSVIVVSTSNEGALARVRSVFTALTIAEYFRDSGKNVMFIADSITRLAMAQREVAAVLKEPPISKGYTTSVFSLLSIVLERATNSDKGTITSFFSVLLEEGDGVDVVGEAVKGIIDGHIVLSKDLFSSGHFPAIDVKSSISRLMNKVASKEHLECSLNVKRWIAAYDSIKDLLNFGAYVSGGNADADEAIEKIDMINAFLRQNKEENYSKEELVEELKGICGLGVKVGDSSSGLMSLL